MRYCAFVDEPAGASLREGGSSIWASISAESVSERWGFPAEGGPECMGELIAIGDPEKQGTLHV